MRHLLFETSLALMSIIISQKLVAQETKLSKSIDKSFKVVERMSLEITNKYGAVIIDTWPRDEVSLKIEILAYGKDESSAEKLMDRVEFDFKHSSDFLEVESVFDRKKSFFKDLVNAVSDYSASLLSKHKLQVNYELIIPENTTSITVDNRFGDVHLTDVKGRLTVKVAHGNFRGNKLKDYARLNISYGKAKIAEINQANVILKGAEMDVGNAGKIDLKSSSSTIIIDRINELDLESTNDKIEIEEIFDLNGKANFTDLQILRMNEICRLNQSYGEMSIKKVPDSFNSIRLNGKSTDYQLTVSHQSGCEIRIFARDDKLNISGYSGKLEKKYTDDKSKFVQVTGDIGKNIFDRKLHIDAQNGEVSIDFIDVQPATYNK